MQNITLKTQNVVEGRKKCRLFSMYLNLNDYLFKSSRYNYGSIYVKPTVATNQKPTADAQKPKRKEFKNTTKENHPSAMWETKRNGQ